ncbi:hypothetical protein CLI64_09315 [Nostoc sp. CENA543]|uniref:hypothetical protein n=1 Tax=Nostoc sp. CENA543 TaxID=1869241 RepID=UPI000CA262D2|nr:hypothetical protein [Nostoc sp. CENA543]AUT00571.1 hypothetical protein CLI64_09315 [Nostoc sp. CENA543]
MLKQVFYVPDSQHLKVVVYYAEKHLNPAPTPALKNRFSERKINVSKLRDLQETRFLTLVQEYICTQLRVPNLREHLTENALKN